MEVQMKQEKAFVPIKKNISLLVSSSALSNMADAIYTLCVSWYVLDRTGSAFLTSAIAAITFIINVFAGPFIGVLVDRTNPKSAMQKAYIAMAFIGGILIISYLLWNDYMVVSVMLMVVINDVAQSFIFPSRNRMLPGLIGNDRVAVVSGYLTSASNTATLMGNAMAGLLLSFIGFIGVMLTHSVFFLLAALLVSWLTLPNYEIKKKDRTKQQYWKEFKEGVKVLRGHRALLALTCMNLGTNIVSIGYLYMVILKTQYGANASQYGIFEAIGVAVSIITGLFVGKLAKKIKPVILLTLSQFISAGCMILFGAGHHLLFAFILFSIQIIFGMFQSIVFGTLLITLVPSEFRARVDSLVISISALMMPVTILIGGYLADHIPIRYIFYVAGAWVMLMGFAPLLSKEVRQLEKI